MFNKKYKNYLILFKTYLDKYLINISIIHGEINRYPGRSGQLWPSVTGFSKNLVVDNEFITLTWLIQIYEVVIKRTIIVW